MTILYTPEFWVLASFIVFVALVVYLGAPAKVTALLDARARRIRAELDEAQKLREEAQGLLAEYQRKRRDAESEAEEIVALAREEARRLGAEAREQLQETLARRQRLAELKIGQAEQQAVADVRAAAADAAVAAAERILAERLTGEAAEDFTAGSIEAVKARLQ